MENQKPSNASKKPKEDKGNVYEATPEQLKRVREQTMDIKMQDAYKRHKKRKM
jgi:hypothetical protein